jgi:serine phosphatase RsbU (regulator of sigma subunit)
MASSYTKHLATAMHRKDIYQLAIAVFFLFGMIGPLTMFMSHDLLPGPWVKFLLLTFLSGFYAAAVILALGKKVWSIIVPIIFLISLYFASHLEEFYHVPENKITVTADVPITLSANQIDDLKTKRTAYGIISIFFLSIGYTLFIRVIAKESHRRASVEAEVKVAQSIHQSLLPSSSVVLPWCSITGKSIAATEIGGDFFDIISLPNDNVVVVIADASGHGTGAGILSAMTKSGILQELQHSLSPATILQHVNEMIFQVTDKKMFITCAIVLLDYRGKKLCYATAGHPPLLHRTVTGDMKNLRTQNTALGLQAHTVFEEQTIPFVSGESVYLLTDGILEATNDKGEQFDLHGVTQALEEIHGKGALDESAAVLNALNAFTRKNELVDDATFVSITLI